MSVQRKVRVRLHRLEVIWRQLSPQRQQQVICLIAHLTLKQVIAQTDKASQEVKNGLSTPETQNPN